MADHSVCAPPLVDSGALINATTVPNASSVQHADKLINSKNDSSRVEGDAAEDQDLLRGLLADTYCHVCDAVLQFESQRLSHYEGKRHAQKVKSYLQIKKTDMMKKDSTESRWTMSSDKDRFCDLCNMVFSSHMVATSHYEGKVHAKNLRKQGLPPPVPNRSSEASSLPKAGAPEPAAVDQGSAPQQGGNEQHAGPASGSTAKSAVDLTDPNKYCALCTASFNNPQMALQHYNGRKHQRNRARQQNPRVKPGDDAQQGQPILSQVVSVELTSMEASEDHAQGLQQHRRDPQQKAYASFADELADYVQHQKARGVAPKTGQLLRQGDAPTVEEEEEEEEEDGQEVFSNNPVSSSDPPSQCFPAPYPPADHWTSLYQRPAWPPHSWDYSCPPPLPPPLPPPPHLLTLYQPAMSRRRRKRSSSSSYSTSYSSSSSSSSSYYSSSAESDSGEHKRRRTRRSRRERRGGRTRDVEEPEKEEQRMRRSGRRKRQRVDGDVEEEQERRRRRSKKHGRRRRKEQRTAGGEEEALDAEAQTRVKQEAERGQGCQQQQQQEEEEEEEEELRLKNRKEKKKVKEKVDTRTEEEKLWDASILG